MSFDAALHGFQTANAIPVTGKYDDRTANALLEGEARPATWLVRIPAGFAQRPFATLLKAMAEQSKLPALSYRNLQEKLAERWYEGRPVNPCPLLFRPHGYVLQARDLLQAVRRTVPLFQTCGSRKLNYGFGGKCGKLSPLLP